SLGSLRRARAASASLIPARISGPLSFGSRRGFGGIGVRRVLVVFTTASSGEISKGCRPRTREYRFDLGPHSLAAENGPSEVMWPEVDRENLRKAQEFRRPSGEGRMECLDEGVGMRKAVDNIQAGKAHQDGPRGRPADDEENPFRLDDPK